MNIGIFTYGTRGDVQPCIALALGLKAKGHDVSIAAPENFNNLVEECGIKFLPLHGDAEAMMNSPEGQQVLQTGNTIKLVKYFYKALELIKQPLRESYLAAAGKVDLIVANSVTLPVISAIAEKYDKKIAYVYFMPPLAPTDQFPVSGLDFISLKGYNKLSYKLAHGFFWKFVKRSVNEFRKELGLRPLTENLVNHVGRQKPLDLYCISPSLIPQPADWGENSKITGFMTVAESGKSLVTATKPDNRLEKWLQKGPAPIYMGFGSNGVGDLINVGEILREILEQTTERILFCKGWSLYYDLPLHPNLFITKYVDHDAVLPKCSAGIFHGGAGTLAAMLRHNLPVIVVSFYSDQPTWGKIIQRKGLGVHIPARKLNPEKLLSAINVIKTEEIRQNVLAMGERIRNEDGVGTAVREIELYFRAK